MKIIPDIRVHFSDEASLVLVELSGNHSLGLPFSSKESSLVDGPKLIQKFVFESVSYLTKNNLSTPISPSWEVDIVFCSNAEIQKINKQSRKKDKPTDVLSFPLYDPQVGLPHTHLGELVISVEFSYQQSQELGHSLWEEFQRLMVHGILHLFRFDHETSPEDEELMQSWEDRLHDHWDRFGFQSDFDRYLK